MQTTTVVTPLGTIRLTADDNALVAVQLMGDSEPQQPGDSPRMSSVLDCVVRQLTEYFAGHRTAFDVPLAPQGTAFQRLVWEQLTAIPHGATRSYGDIACAIGRPGASRAVGAANGRNPIAIIVPCHRVIGANGTLTGYAGGMAAKRWLLDHERRQLRVAAVGLSP